MGSTSSRPDAERLTARTILFKSTGSVEPLRFRTFMAVRGEVAALALVVATPDDHRSSRCRAVSNVMARLLSVSGTSPLALCELYGSTNEAAPEGHTSPGCRPTAYPRGSRSNGPFSVPAP